MAKNKVIFIDKATGERWWITKKGKVFPTNWKLQCAMYSEQTAKKEKQEKLYGRKK